MERLVHVFHASGYKLRVHDFREFSGKTGMHGFACQVEYPKGKFLLAMDGHICAMVNGKIYDTSDTRFDKVWWMWEVIDNE